MKLSRIFSRSPWDNKDNIFNSTSRKKFDFDFFNNLTPPSQFNINSFAPILLVILVLWLLSGIFKIDEGSQAAVLRFGKYVSTKHAGLNYHLPAPIETIVLEKVDASRRIEIGYRSAAQFNSRMRASSSKIDNKIIPEESVMLTGDENIIVLNSDIMWRIKDIGSYLFNIENPEQTVKIVAESAIREVIGKTPISSVLSNQKQKIASEIQELTQQILDSYNSGIQIDEVQLLKTEPPSEVIDAYRDVQTSRADKEREINQAYTYSNDVIPRARGEAAKLIEDAEGYKQAVISRAIGEANRFNALLEQYKLNKQLTKDRIYLDIMEDILKNSNQILISKDHILPHMSINNSN